MPPDMHIVTELAAAGTDVLFIDDDYSDALQPPRL